MNETSVSAHSQFPLTYVLPLLLPVHLTPDVHAVLNFEGLHGQLFFEESSVQIVTILVNETGGIVCAWDGRRTIRSHVDKSFWRLSGNNWVSC